MTAPVSGKMSALKIWLLAARPKTLPASAAPVAVGGAMAYGDGRFDAVTFLVILAAAVLIQIATNFSNDYFDDLKGADDVDRRGPLRVMQAGLVTPAAMRKATVIVLGAALLLGAYLVRIGGLPILCIGVLSLIFSVLYTAGPFPLAYIGLGDVFVLIFFGPVAVGGTYYLLAGPPAAAVLLAGAAVGSIATAILTVNNLRDVEGDRQVGKRTLAVRLGRNFARIEFLALVTLGAVLPLVLISILSGRLAVQLASLYLVAAIPVIRTVMDPPDGEALNHALAGTGRLLLLFAALFSGGWIWGV